MSATVMVVEDEADIMLTIRLTLQADGYRVVGMSTGEDALAAFAGNPPDVTILDVGLPGIDGLEVVRRVRADSSISGARIIMLSAHASGDVRRLTEALHCSAYLTKPFSTGELAATVAAVLAHKPLPQPVQPC
jgi:two-component system KDP operon response regulator KdpE